jgi:hypothetical protein
MLMEVFTLRFPQKREGNKRHGVAGRKLSHCRVAHEAQRAEMPTVWRIFRMAHRTKSVGGAWPRKRKRWAQQTCPPHGPPNPRLGMRAGHANARSH